MMQSYFVRFEDVDSLVFLVETMLFFFVNFAKRVHLERTYTSRLLKRNESVVDIVTQIIMPLILFSFVGCMVTRQLIMYVCRWLKCSNLSSPSDLINVNSLRCEEFKTHSCIDSHLLTFHCILHLSQQVILNIELTVFQCQF